MEETGKIKSGWVKKIFVILFISASLVLCLLIFDSYSGSKIIWDNERANLENGTGGQVQVVKEGPAPTCSDEIQNQGERHVDCGGPCSACQQSPQRPVITSAQKTLISQTILASAFVKDLPSDGVIALRFYDFFLGERIWHDDILIGKTGILSSGTPDLVLIMHARYISQLNGGNLCEVIQAANAAGEMWTESQYSNTKLMLKYASMLKYRDCFGF